MKKSALFIIILLTLLIGSCGDTNVSSSWRKSDITIDGKDSDWVNSLVPLGDINASAGIQNDGGYLYLCLKTNDPEVENKIIGTGLTLWFESRDNGSEKFGIHFPLGMEDYHMPGPGDGMEPTDDMRPAGRDRQSEGKFDQAKMQQEMLGRDTEVEIINSRQDKIRIPLAELKDIQIKAAINDGYLVYEMKMPLNQKYSATYALNAAPGGTFRLGVQTGSSGFANRPGNMPGQGGFDMPPGGDEGGPEGGFGGPGGGFPQGGMGRQGFSGKPVNFWLNVTLASDTLQAK